MTEHPSNSPRARRLAVLLLWPLAFLIPFVTFILHNDHFDRITRARQIARYGELPFRDFFDPGYFMSVLTSAGLQLLLGDNLLGELLLNASFIATGACLVLVLALRATGSMSLALVTAVLSTLTLPRLYDFDKVLFYPLGLLLCWRYAERPTRANVVALGIGLVAAAVFRYDTGVYVGAAALVVISAIHWGEWRTAGRRAGLLVVAVACAALPFALYVEFTAGLGNAADQVITYARREGERTRISYPPRFAFGEFLSFDPPPRANEVQVRWAAAVSAERRRELEAQYRLRDGTMRGEPENNTWAYRLDDTSGRNIRRMIGDWRVEDTHGIDRARGRMPEEPLATWARRIVPVRVLPGAWHDANAAAFLYYLLRTLPVGAALVLLVRAWRVSDGERSSDRRLEVARVLSLIAMCLLLNRFVLRDPVQARVGGIAGPAAVLAAWTASHLWRRAPRARLFVATAVWLTAWSVSAMAQWHLHLDGKKFTRERLAANFAAITASPPGLEVLPSGHLQHLTRYMRECTTAADRIYLSWFAPDLYFFAQRGFAGGMIVTFGGHWSEPRYERRIIEAFESQSVPLAILDISRYREVQEHYPALDEYLQKHYMVGGESRFETATSYRVLVRTDRSRAAFHPPTGMPCFPESPKAWEAQRGVDSRGDR